MKGVGVPRATGLAALGITLAFWTMCLLFPVSAVFARAGGADLLDAEVLAVARATLLQASWSVLFSILIGLPLGLWFGGQAARVRSRVESLLALPYGVPTVVAGAAWVTWLGRSGWLAKLGIYTDWAYSLKAVILAHAFYNIPYVALITAQARASVAERLLESARTLGANGFAMFRHVIWPELKWAVAAAGTQVFALCSMSFVLVMILGGGPPVQTLETALYGRIRFGSLDLAGAAACAVWETILTATPWLVVLFLQARARTAGAHLPAARPSRPASPVRVAAAIAASALFFAPYLSVFSPSRLRSLAASSMLSELSRPFQLSLEIAAMTAIGALVVSSLGLVAAAWARRRSRALGRLIELLLALPSGVSVLVVGLGFLLAYGRWLDPLSGSLLCIVLLQIVLFCPIAFRLLWPVARGASERLHEAAATLGASPWAAFRFVEWPRYRAPALSALALVAGASLGEVAAVSLFYSENLIPLPLVVSRWMAQYRFDEAQGLSAAMLVLSMALMLLISQGRGSAALRPEEIS